jgi:ADP-heptose:LPS heptosyltransferase
MGFLDSVGIANTEKPMPTLNIMLSKQEISDGKKVLDDIIRNDKKTIGIFTYATGAKCHSQEWWGDFYAQLKTRFTDYNIVEILPAENVSQISFKALTYYSRDIREIGSFIANTTIFIGADSGMMHLSSASQTPTVGLFNITDPKIFGPYGNHSVAIDTNLVSIEESVNMVDSILRKISVHS